MWDKLPMHWCRISSIKRITKTSLPKLQHSSQLEAAWTKAKFFREAEGQNAWRARES